MSDTAEKLKILEQKTNELKTLALLTRANAESRFGKQFSGDRDLNTTLGWEETPDYDTYNGQYKRGGIAKTLIDLKPEMTWRGDITVETPEVNGKKTDAGTKFEEAFTKLWKEKRLKEYFLRADKLAGVGQYSTMRLGIKETSGAKPNKAVRGKSSTLLYVSVFSQPNSAVSTVFKRGTDPRFGKVELYKMTEAGTVNRSIARSGSVLISGEEKEVHADRIIHIAEGLDEDEIYGTPRLEAVLNNLYDLQKVTGGSAEMYWRGAFPGFNFALDPEATFDDEQLEKMTKQIDDLILGLGRYTKLQGVKVEELKPQVVSPKNQIDAQLDQIAGTSQIPKRRLIGSERGELASSQDENNLNAGIQSRRETDCDRWLRDFIDRMIRFGILPAVPNYTVSWPSLTSENELDNSARAKNIAEALKAYSDADGESIIPLVHFLWKIIGLDKEVAEDIAQAVDFGLDNDDDDDEDESDNDRIIDDAMDNLRSAATATPATT